MSPEYKKWLDVPSKNGLKKEVQTSLENSNLSLDSCVQEGFYFLLNGGKVSKIILFSDADNLMTKSQQKDALKERSSWHKVDGLKYSAEKGELKPHCNTYTRSYRGKHRSQTKGPWTLRFLYQGKHH